VETGQVSVTAQRVAAHRLTFDRVRAGYGQPACDDALARDVAAMPEVGPGRMRDYLQARTRFFDQVVTRSLDGGCRQVVVGAAGYDGRAWRYAKPGVGWFEVDHPATQRDKLARLRRLGIGTGHVQFVAADFTSDSVANLLAAAGLNPRLPSLFLLEGVAVYLSRDVLHHLLCELRRVAADGSTLAISLSVNTRTPGQAARRAEFQAAVAAVGEPARTVLEPPEAAAVLASAGWQIVPPGSGEPGPGEPRPGELGPVDRAQQAGFVLAIASPCGEPQRRES
jgi:methyltransferase (TIGR00027 family)